MSDAKARLHHTLCDHLERIAKLYTVRPRITLIIRVPGKPDQTVFLSDDNFNEAVAAVKYLYRNADYSAGPDEPPPDQNAQWDAK
jgi:hypothetical protein